MGNDNDNTNDDDLLVISGDSRLSVLWILITKKFK